MNVSRRSVETVAGVAGTALGILLVVAIVRAWNSDPKFSWWLPVGAVVLMVLLVAMLYVVCWLIAAALTWAGVFK